MTNQAQQLFVPGDPKNVPLCPLDKGIILDQAPQRLPDGALLEAQNYIVGPAGPKRRPVKREFAPGQTIDWEPAQGLDLFWTTAGIQKLVLFDKKYIYEITNTAFTRKDWLYTSAQTITVVGTGVEASAAAGWATAANELQAGDIIVLDANGSGDGPEPVEIASITDGDTLVLKHVAVGTYNAGTDYAIRRCFKASSPFLIDSTTFHNKTVICDSSRFPYKYDGADFQGFSAGATRTDYQDVRCIGFWLDRVFIANMMEGAVHHRQRIRWSGIGTANHETFGATDFYDIPYTRGAIQRLIPMSRFLVSYFEDALFVGHPTNKTNPPVNFTQVDTGGIGLVGMQAICRWLDGHIFVGQDNIYFFDSKGIQPIGTPIISKSIDECENWWRIYARLDPFNSRIVFGFPKTGTDIEDLWSFNYKSKSWSHDQITGSILGTFGTELGVTWADLSGTVWTDLSTTYPTWGSMRAMSATSTRLWTVTGDKLYRFEPGSADDDAGAIQATFTTKDLDHKAPNRSKTWFRVSLKVQKAVTTAIEFDVYASKDRGSTWKRLSSDDKRLVVAVGKDEGYLNFKVKGSLARFRFVTASTVEPFTVNEIVFRVRGGGQDIIREFD